MDIRSVRHRGLRYLIEEDSPRFLQPALIERVRKILTVLILAETIAEAGMSARVRVQPETGVSPLEKWTASSTI